jgi:hypothetical protein
MQEEQPEQGTGLVALGTDRWAVQLDLERAENAEFQGVPPDE